MRVAHEVGHKPALLESAIQRANKESIGKDIMNIPIHMTLGDLIVAVTDEVEHSTGNGDTTNLVVAQILNRLFSEGKVRFTRRPAS